MQENNDIKLEQKGEVTIMNIRGDITSFSETPLTDSFQKAVAQGARKIILNFDKDAYINSGGIALLIQIMYQISENKQDAAITGLSDHFKKIFNMVGITKFAKIFDTVDQALEGMGDSLSL
jgi:anti-anti-sigma factor